LQKREIEIVLKSSKHHDARRDEFDQSSQTNREKKTAHNEEDQSCGVFAARGSSSAIQFAEWACN
jgi:hypothetical protein